MTDTDLVLQALKNIKEACSENPDVKPGVIDNLSSTICLLQKIRKIGAPKTIGFFGAQKRGKSSLINQLLGCDLMPVGPVPMSSVVIKVKHDINHAVNKYTLDVTQVNGGMDSYSDMSLESAKLLLKQYGTRDGEMSCDVDTIEVTSNFSSSMILEHEGILVDTPGAEVAFAENLSDAENNEDAARAIRILEKTHIVIFVERADCIQAENSKIFFQKNLKPLRPFNVINYKDTFDISSKSEESDALFLEKKKQDCMKGIMLQTFGVNLDRILCVSCKEAKDAKRDNDPKMLEISNLPKLEKAILNELDNLKPEIGLVTCLKELKKVMSQINAVDSDTAKEVFQNAKRPISVLQNGTKINAIKNITGELNEQYS